MREVVTAFELFKNFIAQRRIRNGLTKLFRIKFLEILFEYHAFTERVTDDSTAIPVGKRIQSVL